MTWLLWLSVYGGLSFGFGLLCGAMIHRGHPISETPIRLIKDRGEFVDRVI